MEVGPKLGVPKTIMGMVFWDLINSIMVLYMDPLGSKGLTGFQKAIMGWYN